MQKTLQSAEYQRLLRLLVAVRRAADKSQQELADAIGEHQSFVAKYEGGQRRLDLIEFVAIAKALRQDPLELMASFLGRSAGHSIAKKRKKALDR